MQDRQSRLPGRQLPGSGDQAPLESARAGLSSRAASAEEGQGLSCRVATLVRVAQRAPLQGTVRTMSPAAWERLAVRWRKALRSASLCSACLSSSRWWAAIISSSAFACRQLQVTSI